MTDLRALLAPIRARLAAATPGPWLINDREQTVRVEHPQGGKWLGEIMYDRSSEGYTDWTETYRRDAEFIAAAPTDLSRLLAAIEAVTELAEAWQARGEHLRKSAESAPEDVQQSLDDQAADMIWHANLVRSALAAALGADTTKQEGTQ